MKKTSELIHDLKNGWPSIILIMVGVWLLLICVANAPSFWPDNESWLTLLSGRYEPIKQYQMPEEKSIAEAGGKRQ